MKNQQIKEENSILFSDISVIEKKRRTENKSTGIGLPANVFEASGNTLNYIETLRGEKQISSDAFGAEGGGIYRELVESKWYKSNKKIAVYKGNGSQLVGYLNVGEYIQYHGKGSGQFVAPAGFSKIYVNTQNISSGGYLISDSQKKNLSPIEIKPIIKTRKDGISCLLGSGFLAQLHNKVGRASIVTVGVLLRFLHPHKFPDSLFVREWDFEGKPIKTYNSVKNGMRSDAGKSEYAKFIADTNAYLKNDSSKNQIDNYQLLSRLTNEIIGKKHLSAEGLFMNELVDGKPVGVTDPAIHDGGFDDNAGKNPPEEGEMHIGFKMGGGAYSDSGEQVGAYAPEAKGLSKSNVLGMPSYQIAGISTIGGLATAYALIRFTKVNSTQALLIGALAGVGAYFLSDKFINKNNK